MIKIAFKGLLIILSLYILYVVIAAVVLFYVPLKTGEETTSIKPDSFFGHSESTDRVRLL
ncbi:phospholipase, partial [Priestia megaterium]